MSREVEPCLAWFRWSGAATASLEVVKDWLGLFGLRASVPLPARTLNEYFSPAFRPLRSTEVDVVPMVSWPLIEVSRT